MVSRICSGNQVSTALYLIPQVFGWAAYISIEVGHVDKLGDASLSGCFGNLLRDGHEDIVEAKVPFTQKEEKHVEVNYQSHIRCP